MTTPHSPTDPANPPEFQISRDFDAPRALVWRAWTEPAQLARWWGPKDFTNPVCELDLRAGGAYRITMRSPDGAEYPMTGFFREVSPPSRLVMTQDVSGHPDSWHDQVNPHRDRSKPAVLVLVQTVTFEDLGSRTRVTIRTRFDSVAIRDAMVKMGMNEGWSQSLERLAALLVQP